MPEKTRRGGTPIGGMTINVVQRAPDLITTLAEEAR
jgi:hypothetical protein